MEKFNNAKSGTVQFLMLNYRDIRVQIDITKGGKTNAGRQGKAVRPEQTKDMEKPAEMQAFLVAVRKGDGMYAAAGSSNTAAAGKEMTLRRTFSGNKGEVILWKHTSEEEKMEKYYFTFGSWNKFPYQNAYLVVVSSGYEDAVRGFREKHPDISPDCLNCSDCYSERQWEAVGRYYAGRPPAEIILTETCYGRKAGGYADLFLSVPEAGQIIRISEGSGDNLSSEDMDNGYVDYIYYDQYELSSGMPEVDGGQILLKEPLRRRYRCMADCIPDVLDMAYGNRLAVCMIL